METSRKLPVRVAEDFWLVFFAYFLATAAWYTVSGIAFTSSQWRTVAETRKRGQRHVFVLSLPMPYLAVYLYIQAKSGDHKEVCLTLVAFFVSILHILRTVMGLWQLHVFKHWVMRSICSMGSLGYRIQLPGSRNGMNMHRGGYSVAAQVKGRDRAHFDADNIIVNDTIVGSSLSEGDVQCYLRVFTLQQNHNISNARCLLMRALLTLCYGVESTVCLGGIVRPLLFSRSSLYSKHNSTQFLQPRDPEELWLRWATVFISCAFPEWLADMRKSRPEDFLSQESEYQVHRDRFAEDILRSAALHCERGTETSSRSLLPVHLWHKFPKLSSGIFCKQEFLEHACITGNGLPFQAPHKRPASRIEEDLVYSYAKYRSKLEEARDALPVNEREKLACLGIEELEWLSVLLSVDDWSIGKAEEGNGHENQNNVQPSNCDSSGIAIENLRNQLGFPESVSGFSQRLDAPFLKGKGATLWGNRNVLTLSAHVDNWLALLAGEQVANMVKQEPGMEERFSFRNLNAKCSDSRTPEPVRVTEEITEENIRFDKHRLMLQLSVSDPQYSHFEHSLTFLGCSMENLRSSMAKWVESNPEEQSGAWVPTLGSSGVNTNAMNGGKFEFHASKDFELCLSEVSSISCWSQRYLQMRLLWELQNKLHNMLPECGLPPHQSEAILLCILSFPVIRMIASEIEQTPESTFCAQGNRNFCCIKVDEEPRVFRIENCRLTLSASFGPQNVHIEVFFANQENGSGVVVSAQLCGDEFKEGKSFVWEAWRDAFCRSLQSIRQWQSKHQIFNSKLSLRPYIHSIGTGICEIETVNSGIGPTMKVWKGWPPHRETLSKYEMMTDGLILERKKTVEVPAKARIVHVKGSTFVVRKSIQYVPVNYEETTGQNLTRASLIARHSLRKAASCSVDGTVGESSKGPRDLELLLYEFSTTKSRDDIALDRAMNMLISGIPNREAIERVVELLEGYFTSEATKAPSVRILESLSRPVRNENWVQKIKGHYDVLITATRWDPIAAISFAGFCSSVSSYRREIRKEDGIRALVIAIIRTTYSGNIFAAFELTKSLEMIMGAGNEESHFLACSMVFNKIEHATKILSRARKGAAWTNAQHVRRGPMPSLGTLQTSYIDESVPLLPNFKSELEKKKANTQDRLKALFLRRHIYGVGDYASRALELYSQAADDGDLAAAHALGFMFEYGVGVSLDWSRAAELYTRAVSGGIDSALCPLAGLYVSGRGVTRNLSYAAELYTQAIEKRGDVMAMHNLAGFLQRGTAGVPVDLPRAIRLLSRAAEEGGDVNAMQRLAQLLHSGLDGVPTDLPYAVQLYERAIEERGDFRAKINLALLLECGADGVPVNLKRAAALYKSAVHQAGDTLAMIKLAVLYQKGTGVPHDALRATQLFQRVIDMDGDVNAMLLLADMLMQGAIGVPQDPIRAVALYTRAIGEHGSGDAMFKLASLLEFGEDGVPSDPARAFSLYNRAASEKKHRRAARRLKKVEKHKEVLEQVQHIWSK